MDGRVKMAACRYPNRNEVTYMVEAGLHYKKVKIKCGGTNPYGNRAICDDCLNDPAEMREIERHEKNVAADNAWLRSAGWGEM